MAEGPSREIEGGVEGRGCGHAARLERGDGQTAEGLLRWEAVANGEPGAPKGRELEFAELLSYLKRRRVRNVVWLTADVQPAAPLRSEPGRVPGLRRVPGVRLAASDPTRWMAPSGPQVVFFKAPRPGRVNLSPYAGLQFFGEVNVDAHSFDMTVELRDLEGLSVFSKTLRRASAEPPGHSYAQRQRPAAQRFGHGRATAAHTTDGSRNAGVVASPPPSVRH